MFFFILIYHQGLFKAVQSSQILKIWAFWVIVGDFVGLLIFKMGPRWCDKQFGDAKRAPVNQ